MERFYQTCLKEELAQRLRKNSRYSLRSFAKALDIDAGALSRIISGQKIPTPELSEKILNQLTLNKKQAQNFVSSMAEAYEESGHKRTRAPVKEMMKKPRVSENEIDLSPAVFSIIADWYHHAILQLIETENFKNDTKWMAQTLGIQEMEVKLALSRLLQLDLIKFEDGKMLRTHERIHTGDVSVTNSALKKRIKQISEKSVYSLENHDIKKRSHTTMTMGIDPDKIPLAKEMIDNFMDKLSEVLETKKKNVYELQINLFPLQEIEK